MSIVGIVGAGVMGTGLAFDAASAGHAVVLVDNQPEALRRARDEIRQQCRMSRLLHDREIDASEVLGRIEAGTDPGTLAPAELVVENVPEKWETKRTVHRRLAEVCTEDCVIVVNTSAVPITRIAGLLPAPERVIGVHFMNPVPLKKSVELIPGFHTSAETVARTKHFLGTIGKMPIEVADSCGFVSNRVLMLTVNEAIFLVYERVADASTVDRVFRDCFGHPMGPLQTADLIGLDTILYSLEVLQDGFGDDKFRPCPLLRQMVFAGLHGQKSGQGFYDYASTAAPLAADR